MNAETWRLLVTVVAFVVVVVVFVTKGAPVVEAGPRGFKLRFN